MSAALSLICRTILHDYASVCKRVSSTARRTVPGRRVRFSARRSSSLVLAILNWVLCALLPCQRQKMFSTRALTGTALR